MTKITRAQLEKIVGEINLVLGTNPEPYTQQPDGSISPNPGTVYIAGGFSGVRLERISNGGGSSDFLSSGFETKRRVWELAQAWLQGYRAAK